jgi:hypothetical protein
LKRVIMAETVSASFNSQPPSEITIRNTHFQRLKTHHFVWRKTSTSEHFDVMISSLLDRIPSETFR